MMKRLCWWTFGIVFLGTLAAGAAWGDSYAPEENQKDFGQHYYSKSKTRLEVMEKIMQLYGRFSKLQCRGIRFWMENGPDREYGGFHGALDEAGGPMEFTDKGVIVQARYLWTFSSLYASGDRRKEIKAICDDLYQFFISHFLDPEDHEFYWMTARDGSVVNDEKRLYSNSFAIYALSQYAMAFNDKAAAEHALNCFKAIDQRTHDDLYGGFDQSAEPNWLAVGSAKGTNTHMHLMESFTSLYKATGNELVKERLNELVEIFITHIIQPDNHCAVEFEKDWTPVNADIVNYGHDIQSTWLLYEAAEALGREEEPEITAKLTAMGALTAAQGFDPESGGMFYEGDIAADAVTNFEKIWWVQAETLSGLWRLFRLNGDTAYLDKIEKTLSWIEVYQVNKTAGEWYWAVDPQGEPLETYGSDMANEWKASYHSMRSLMFMQKWMFGYLISH